jgi:ribosomal-protein-alanine N-acetyltransferase
MFPERMETDRLVLEGLSRDAGDVLDLHRHMAADNQNAREELQLLPWGPFETSKETRDWIREAENQLADGQRATYLIRARESPEGPGDIVGVTYLDCYWDRRAGTFGFWLRKPFFGRGYSAERAGAFLQLAFERLNLELVAVTHQVGNERSRRAIEKYVDRFADGLDGAFQNFLTDQDGASVDSVRYTIRRGPRQQTVPRTRPFPSIEGSRPRPKRSFLGNGFMGRVRGESPIMVTGTDTESTLPITARSIALGALAGVAAYLLGYLLAGVLASGNVPESLRETVPTWKSTGWYFYNAHFVDLTSTLQIGSASGGATGSLIEGSDSGTVQLLYVVPPIAVALVGATLFRWFDSATTIAGGAARGALVVVGYLPLGVVGAIATGHTVETGGFLVEVSGTIEPELVPSIVLVGILYPIVFGAIGGAIASRL